ncbi:MAG: TM2 domain-containing protein [Gemmatimonadota bacterium]
MPPYIALAMASKVSDKSRLTSLLLALPLGAFGAHRFHVGRTRSAALQLLTLGGVGLWWLYDIITIAAGSFRDAEGRLVARWQTEDEIVGQGELPEQVLQELEALRAEVLELAERLDFAERMLARGRDPAAIPPAPAD